MRNIRIPINVLLFLLAYVAWLSPLHMPAPITLLLRVIVLLVAISKCKIRIIQRDILFWFFLSYSIVVLLSAAIYDTGLVNLLKTVSFVIMPLTIYIIAMSVKNIPQLINVVYVGVCTYFALDLFFALFTSEGTGINGNGQPLYFTGGKFQICYIYMLLLTMTFLKFKVHVIIKITLLVLGILLAVHVDCGTGAIGILVFGIAQFTPSFFFRKKRGFIWFWVLLIINYLIVIAQVQTNSPLIRNIIVNILHRDIGLTGRNRIYNNISEIMSGHWVLGYGYTNKHIMDYTRVGDFDGIENMQNGFLHTIYISGLIGMAIYFLILVVLFKRIGKIAELDQKKILLSAVSAFLVIAIVEIPFSSGIFNLLIGMTLLALRQGHVSSLVSQHTTWGNSI